MPRRGVAERPPGDRPARRWQASTDDLPLTLDRPEPTGDPQAPH